MVQYYVKRGTLTRGPFGEAETQARIRGKKLKPSDEVGLSNTGPWHRLSDVYKQVLDGSYAQPAGSAVAVAEAIPVELVECHECGHEVSEDTEICPQCGVSLLDDIIVGVSEDDGGSDDEVGLYDDAGDFADEGAVDPYGYEDYGTDTEETSSYDTGPDVGMNAERGLAARDARVDGGRLQPIGGIVRDTFEALGPMRKVPREIQELLAGDERIYYAGRPSSMAMMVDLALTLWLLVLAPFAMYLRWTEWKNIVYVVTNRRIIVRAGIFRRDIQLIPVQNIQSMTIQTGFFNRMLGLNTVVFMTASGVFGNATFRRINSGDVMKAVGEALPK